MLHRAFNFKQGNIVIGARKGENGPSRIVDLVLGLDNLDNMGKFWIFIDKSCVASFSKT